MKGSILLCGVGGMGILKASEIIAEVLLQKGLSVRQSEVHGMAQRGGSVVTHLRFGEEVYAPLLVKGEADFMLAFEEMEALRYLPYLKKGGTILLNTFRFFPPGTETRRYPQEVPTILKKAGFALLPVNATAISLKLGDSRFTNVVLLGAFSRVFFVDDPTLWREAMEKTLAEKNLAKNLQAFEEGRQCAERLYSPVV
ncbi:MAG: indolepyruvate oxidoreductase subunit beta [Candidatus Caldatribacteriaceae bacterium]